MKHKWLRIVQVMWQRSNLQLKVEEGIGNQTQDPLTLSRRCSEWATAPLLSKLSGRNGLLRPITTSACPIKLVLAKVVMSQRISTTGGHKIWSLHCSARGQGRAETCVVCRSLTYYTLVRNGRVTRINICSGGNKEFEIGRARLDEGSPEGGSRESRWRFVL